MSHLPDSIALTLTDLSPAMLEVSRALIPRAEHLVGDMRTVRLGRTFDAVLIHDAICYMTTEADLRAAFVTAFEHLRPGGAGLFQPDYVRETFAAGTDHGGEDGPALADGRPGRALRYLEWTTDPDPADYDLPGRLCDRDARRGRLGRGSPRPAHRGPVRPRALARAARRGRLRAARRRRSVGPGRVRRRPAGRLTRSPAARPLSPLAPVARRAAADGRAAASGSVARPAPQPPAPAPWRRRRRPRRPTAGC